MANNFAHSVCIQSSSQTTMQLPYVSASGIDDTMKDFTSHYKKHNISLYVIATYGISK